MTDRRQILLIRGRYDDKNFFRRQKTAVGNFTEFELSCLVWGAACLPKDEFENWIDTVKSKFNYPLGRIYLKWLSRTRSQLKAKLKAKTSDHPE